MFLGAARKLHTNATDEQIAAPIKIWLAHAKERMQRQTILEGRKEREEKDVRRNRREEETEECEEQEREESP